MYRLGTTRGVKPNGRGGLFGFGDVYPLKPGVSAPEVTDWQRVLKSIGFDVDLTGTYDAKTQAATLEFKGAAGLPNTPDVDDATLEAGASAVDAKGGGLTVPLVGPQVTPALNIVAKVKAHVPTKWWPFAVAGGVVLLVGLTAWGVSKIGKAPQRRRAHA